MREFQRAVGELECLTDLACSGISRLLRSSAMALKEETGCEYHQGRDGGGPPQCQDAAEISLSGPRHAGKVEGTGGPHV